MCSRRYRWSSLRLSSPLLSMVFCKPTFELPDRVTSCLPMSSLQIRLITVESVRREHSGFSFLLGSVERNSGVSDT
ncbi:hypothetical protein DE146DRAFT_426024 [Phaeosphaeria sp. MPI-PUGE-AT-0046c]|nr:hypothetical protein DE146DRAFT_426024 [Phaeosphaeria sp. MPI-PUGE-AT-0046c]